MSLFETIVHGPHAYFDGAVMLLFFLLTGRWLDSVMPVSYTHLDVYKRQVGGRYSDEWHVQHLKDPRAVVPESIMPPYAFLAERELNAGDMRTHLQALYRVGVPLSLIHI